MTQSELPTVYQVDDHNVHRVRHVGVADHVSTLPRVIRPSSTVQRKETYTMPKAGEERSLKRPMETLQARAAIKAV